MAEVEPQVTVYNKALISFRETLERLKKETPEEHLPELDLASGLFTGFLVDRRKQALEEILRDKGLSVCHFENLHYFENKPEGFVLDERLWELGLFPKSEERLLFRGETRQNYGGNTELEVLSSDLIVLCPHHFPKYSATLETHPTKDGWRSSIYSGVYRINGKLHPVAELGITINEPEIRKRPEAVYKHFGFI